VRIRWMNDMDLTSRPAGKWIFDFEWTVSAGDATVYEEPFRWMRSRSHPMRRRAPIVIGRDDDTTVRGRMNSRSSA